MAIRQRLSEINRCLINVFGFNQSAGIDVPKLRQAKSNCMVKL
jgi:hypothetical protein